MTSHNRPLFLSRSHVIVPGSSRRSKAALPSAAIIGTAARRLGKARPLKTSRASEVRPCAPCRTQEVETGGMAVKGRGICLGCKLAKALTLRSVRKKPKLDESQWSSADLKLEVGEV